MKERGLRVQILDQIRRGNDLRLSRGDPGPLEAPPPFPDTGIGAEHEHEEPEDG